MRLPLSLLAAFALVLALMPVAATASPASPAASPDSADDSILVKVDDAAAHAVANVGSVTGTIPGIDVDIVTVPTGTATSAIAAYAAVPGVVFAEANLAQSLLSDAPNDPLLDDAYWVDRTNAVAGWAAYNATQDADFAPSGGATLAVLDSGIDLSHPEFAGKIVDCRSFLTSTGAGVPGVCQDNNFHGTYVSGVATAIADNGEGIAGIGFDADLMALQVCTLLCFTADSAAAMVYAADNGADVANYSFGGANPSETSRLAVEYAAGKGVLQIASAGNSGREGPNSVGFPAGYPQVMAVGATDPNDERAAFSSFGPEVEVVAPGANTLSTMPSAGLFYTDRFSGTSFSGPMVAGLGALLRNLDLDAAEARQAIIDGADLVAGETGFSDEYGFGRINVEASILSLEEADAEDAVRGQGIGNAPVEPGPPSEPGPPERTTPRR